MVKSALVRAEGGTHDLAAGCMQDRPEDTFDLAGTAFDGVLTGGLFLPLLLLDLAAQLLHFLLAGGLFPGSSLLGLLGGAFDFLGGLLL